jgi:hypothetical protein
MEGYKYIKATDGKHELYNIEKDPAEGANVILPQNERATEMRKVLESWENSFEKSLSETDVDIDRATLKRLEDLGYI